MKIMKFGQQVFKEWNEDKVSRLAAALSYYTVFSLAPLLIVIIAVAGLVFGADLVQKQLVAQLSALVGQSGADLINNLLNHTRNMGANILATALGIVTILLGASGVVGELKDSLNTIWNVAPKPGQSIFATIRDRVLSFAMVLGIGFLLMASLALSTGLSALGTFLGGYLQPWYLVARVVDVVISFGGITLLFAILFKFLPDAKIRWRDVWIGALVTALLFTIGKYLIGLYLGNSNIATPFGAAGSLVILFVWICYAAQILFLGAEITQVYANRYGAGVKPAPDAIALSDEQRVKQGTLKPGTATALTTQRETPAPVTSPPPVHTTRGRFNPIQLALAAIGIRIFPFVQKIFAVPARFLHRRTMHPSH